MTRLCPGCWQPFEAGGERCPRCGRPVAADDAASYEVKLLDALGHPVPEVRMLAVQILGERKSTRAVPALVTLLNDEHADFYLQREALLALARIGSLEALQAVRAACGHPSRLVRDLARRLSVGGEGPR